jgi:hypothetical protein
MAMLRAQATAGHQLRESLVIAALASRGLRGRKSVTEVISTCLF